MLKTPLLRKIKFNFPHGPTVEVDLESINEADGTATVIIGNPAIPDAGEEPDLIRAVLPLRWLEE